MLTTEKTHNGSVPELQEFTQHLGFHKVLLEWVRRMLGVGAQTPILDLGCGSGAWLSELAQHGFNNLHGVDNESFVPFPAAGLVSASFVHAGLDDDTDLGLGGTKFGLITAIEVIEHCTILAACCGSPHVIWPTRAFL